MSTWDDNCTNNNKDIGSNQAINIQLDSPLKPSVRISIKLQAKPKSVAGLACLLAGLPRTSAQTPAVLKLG
jgi:hypothetical protein